MRISILAAGLVLFALTVTVPIHISAQQAPKPAPRPKATTPQGSAQSRPAAPQVEFTAKSANVVQAGTPVKIQLLRWSTDEERMKLVAAFSAPPAGRSQPPATTSEGAEGREAAAGRAGRGAAGARGRGGRGGRDDAAPSTPEQRLEAALTEAPTLGYIWTNDVTGYAIKYAARMPGAGGERIVLVTDRRIGIYTTSWNPVGASPTDYEFTLLEMRLDAKGSGEAKTSLAAKIAIDNDAHTLALENFMAAPAQLQGVKRRVS